MSGRAAAELTLRNGAYDPVGPGFLMPEYNCSSAGDKQIFSTLSSTTLIPLQEACAADTSYTKVFINTTTTGGTTHFLGFDVSLANHTCVATYIVYKVSSFFQFSVISLVSSVSRMKLKNVSGAVSGLLVGRLHIFTVCVVFLAIRRDIRRLEAG